MANFKYQESESYAILFDESEEYLFGVPQGLTNVGVIIKPVPCDHNLYFSG